MRGENRLLSHGSFPETAACLELPSREAVTVELGSPSDAYALLESGSPARQVLLSDTKSTWLSWCKLVLLVLLAALAVVGLKVLLPLATRVRTAKRCTACAETYYTAAACALGGQPLVGIGDGSWLEVGGWAELSRALAPGAALRAELEALLSSDRLGNAARCPRWAEWSPAQSACVAGSNATRRGACPREPDGREEGFADNSHKDCASNFYRDARASSDHGGICTCADGREYEVSDHGDDCWSLACEGGKPGACSHRGTSEVNRRKTVTCQPDFVGAARLEDADPAEDSTCWDNGLPRFVVPSFSLSCQRQLVRVRMPAMEKATDVLFGDWDHSNAVPYETRYGDFSVFYDMFYDTEAGSMCRERFGLGRPGGPRLPLDSDSLNESWQDRLPYDFLGCYKDWSGGRDFKIYKGYRHNVPSCSRACQGYAYYALQYKGECYCGDAYATGIMHNRTDDLDCAEPCAAGMNTNPIAFSYARCGSGWRNAVYRRGRGARI